MACASAPADRRSPHASAPPSRDLGERVEVVDVRAQLGDADDGRAEDAGAERAGTARPPRRPGGDRRGSSRRTRQPSHRRPRRRGPRGALPRSPAPRESRCRAEIFELFLHRAEEGLYGETYVSPLGCRAILIVASCEVRLGFRVTFLARPCHSSACARDPCSPSPQAGPLAARPRRGAGAPDAHPIGARLQAAALRRWPSACSTVRSPRGSGAAAAAHWSNTWTKRLGALGSALSQAARPARRLR